MRRFEGAARTMALQDMKASKASSWKMSHIAAVFFVVIIAALILVFVVPVLTGLVASAGNRALKEFVAALVDVSPFSLWPLASSYDGWVAPAALFTSVLLVFAGGAAIYLRKVLSDRDIKGALNAFGPGASDTNAKGSARTYSSPDLIAEIDDTANEDIAPEYGSLVIGCLHGKGSVHDRLILAPSESHCLVLGMTGSGKTQMVNFPSIWAMANAEEPCSAVILDPKGELYSATAPYVRAQGIKTEILDFKNPELSMCVNPLSSIVSAFFDKKEIHDEQMRCAFEVASRAGIEKAKVCDEAAWAHASAGDYLEFQTHVKRAEAAKRSGWSRAEALTRDVALAIIRDAEEEGASAGAQHWLDVGRSALEALILLCATYTTDDYIGDDEPYPEPYPEQRTLPSVLAILQKYSGVEGASSQEARGLVELFDNIDPDHPASKAFSPIRTSQDREIATTLAEALKFLTKLISSDVEAFLNRNDVDFGALGEQRTFLYLIVPTDRAAAGRMFVLLFQQMHQSLIDRATRYGNRLPVRVNFLLEEFASVCQGNKVQNLPDMLTVGRSYNMRFYITAQNLSQLSKIYDEHTLNTILDNCGTKVLIKTSDATGTARFFSQAVGKYTFTAQNESRSRSPLALFDRSRAKSTREEERAYFTEDEIARWPEEFGALVLQAKPGRKPNDSKRARKLGWNGILYPLVVQTKKAYQIDFVARAFALDDADELAKRIERAQGEVRVEGRSPLIAWDPYAKSASERETVKRQLYAGGISLESKRELARKVQRGALKAKARALLAKRLDIEALRVGSLRYMETLIENLCEEYTQSSLARAVGEDCAKASMRQAKEAAYKNACICKDFWYEDLTQIIGDPAEPTWLYKIDQPAIDELSVVLSEKALPQRKEDSASARRDGNKWIDPMRQDIKAARAKAQSMVDFIRILQGEYRIRVDFRPSGSLVYARMGKPHELVDAKVGKGFSEKELEERFSKKKGSVMEKGDRYATGASAMDGRA